MKRFFRILHWAARSRYWKQRALKAEAARESIRQSLTDDIAELQAQLNAELWRQVERGDMFTSAAIMGTRQMYGIPPRVGPAPVKKDTPQQNSYDPMVGLSGIEKMEFQTYWLPDALRAGITEATALNSFRAELAQRKSIRDEGSVG